jgi:hypothetical protein
MYSKKKENRVGVLASRTRREAKCRLDLDDRRSANSFSSVVTKQESGMSLILTSIPTAQKYARSIILSGNSKPLQTLSLPITLRCTDLHCGDGYFRFAAC